MWVLVRRERRISLPQARDKSGGLLFHEDIQYRTATVRSKARVGMPIDECLKHSDYTRVSPAFSC